MIGISVSVHIFVLRHFCQLNSDSFRIFSPLSSSSTPQTVHKVQRVQYSTIRTGTDNSEGVGEGVRSGGVGSGKKKLRNGWETLRSPVGRCRVH